MFESEKYFKTITFYPSKKFEVKASKTTLHSFEQDEAIHQLQTELDAGIHTLIIITLIIIIIISIII